MPSNNQTLSEQFFGQVSESLQMVFDLTSRIDERVKTIVAKQEELENHLDKLKENSSEINEKMIVMQDHKKDIEILHDKVQNLEVKMESLNLRIGNHDNHWTQIFDAIWKVALMLVAGYILYKLGLQAPPNL